MGWAGGGAMVIKTATCLIAGLVLLLPRSAITQDDLVEVAFPCALEIGDVAKLQITRSREQAGPGTRPISTSVRNDVTFEVTERNKTGFVLAWRTDWDNLIDALGQRGVPGDADWVVDTMKQMADHELLIQTDELCSPLDLVNLDETVELFHGLLDRMIESLPMTDEQRAAMEPLIAGLLTPEVLMSRVLQDAILYFMFTGGSYEVGADYEYEEMLPNPLGGAPFPSQVTFQVASADHDAVEARVSYRQETDSNAVQSFLREFFKKVPDGDDLLKEMEDYDLGIFSRAEYTMSLHTGLPQRIHFVRTVRMGPGQRADATEIITTSHSSEKD
jgi:hypothetical protein